MVAEGSKIVIRLTSGGFTEGRRKALLTLSPRETIWGNVSGALTSCNLRARFPRKQASRPWGAFYQDSGSLLCFLIAATFVVHLTQNTQWGGEGGCPLFSCVVCTHHMYNWQLPPCLLSCGATYGSSKQNPQQQKRRRKKKHFPQSTADCYDKQHRHQKSATLE